MMRLTTGLTASLRSLSIAGPARPLLGSKPAVVYLHSSAWNQDMATGAESVKTSKKLTGAKSTKKSTTGAAKAAAPKKKAAAAKPKAAPRPKRVLNPPKRSASPWIFFFTEKMNALDPSERKNVTELSKTYGDEYRALSADEKASLQQRVDEHKAQWEKDMASYMEKVTPQMIQEENAYRRERRKNSPKKTNLKLLRDPSKPTQPLNGYMRFSEAMRASTSLQSEKLDISGNLKDMPVAEQGKALAAAWRGLSDEEKKPYHEAYEKEKVTYDQELARWKEQQGQQA